MIKILSWDILGRRNYNCNNITAVDIKSVREVIESENPDICILYSYWLAYAEKLELEKLGYECTVNLDYPERDCRNRVLVASKFPFTFKKAPTSLKFFQKDWVEMELVIGERVYDLLAVKVPSSFTHTLQKQKINTADSRGKFFQILLQRFKEYSSKATAGIIIGNFNLNQNTTYSPYLDKYSGYLTDVSSQQPNKTEYCFVNDALNGTNDIQSYAPIKKPDTEYGFRIIEISRKEDKNGNDNQ